MPFLLLFLFLLSANAYASTSFKEKLKRELLQFQGKVSLLKETEFKNSLGFPYLRQKGQKKEKKDPYYLFFKERELWKGK